MTVYMMLGKKEGKMTLLDIPALNKRCFFRHFQKAAKDLNLIP